MKFKVTITIMALAVMAFSGTAQAQTQADIYRDETTFSKMLTKLGRGLVNVVTSPVEIPRNIAIEWERTDPVSGVFLGTIKGIGWAFARAATGAYEAVTFPIPIPEDYEPMMDPPYIITDVWGDSIPDIGDLHSNDPMYDDDGVHPQRFRF